MTNMNYVDLWNPFQPEELEVLATLTKAWNQFVMLTQLHPDEQPDFRRAIHDAQRIITSRPGQRHLNFETLSGVGTSVCD